MSTNNRPIPSDEQVIKLLESSRRDSDPRVAALVTLILYMGLSLSQAKRLRWAETQIGERWLITQGSRSIPAIDQHITPWIARQLIAIGVRRNGVLVFAKPTADAPTPGQLLKRALKRAGLDYLSWPDLAAWSEQQSPGRRASLANN